jgi:carbamoyltransferase
MFNNSMNILSIYLGHDSNVCLLKNGELIFYLKEERFSRKKRDEFPYISIKKIFENFNETIDYICISSIIPNTGFIDFLIKQYNIDLNKLITFYGDHHLCHSFISFSNSGFDECISLVVDGGGSIYEKEISECESILYHSKDKQFLEIQKNLYKSMFFNNNYYKKQYNYLILEKIKSKLNCECYFNGKIGGITSLYNTASYLISESVLENGKAMGLSSYGKKIEQFPKLFVSNSEKVNEELFEIDYEKNIILYKPYKNKITKEVTQKNYKFYADYAYEIQTQTQEAVGNLIEEAIKKTGIKKVCISGGYGMNVVANYYYLKRFPDVEFYFEPLSDDSGISIGAAKLFYHQKIQDKTIRPLKTTSFHGVAYDISSYKEQTKSVGDVAKIIYQDKSVAVYTGLAEAGQRALGNRSILFNALNPDAKDLVNKIKNREWYRPFAAMVLEEDASIYFDMGRIKSSSFMTICFPVRQEYVKIIPGVTHVDDTCRVQTVSQGDGYLYKLLQEFKKLSGHGILLNTSFNLAGKPLVETPEDAFNTLNNSCLDYLWFEETQQLFKNKKSMTLSYK